MFYSKYSDYSPEQIKTKKYEELCKEFLSMAKKVVITGIFDKWRQQMKGYLENDK